MLMPLFLPLIVKQNGHATLTVSLPGGKKETYLITLRKSRYSMPDYA